MWKCKWVLSTRCQEKALVGAFSVLRDCEIFANHCSFEALVTKSARPRYLSSTAQLHPITLAHLDFMDFISRRHKWANISIGLPWLQSTINLLSFTSSNQRNHHLVIFWFDFSWFHNQQQIDQILMPPWIILKILFQFYDHDHDLVFFPFVILQRVGDDMIRMQIKLDCGDTAGWLWDVPLLAEEWDVMIGAGSRRFRDSNPRLAAQFTLRSQPPPRLRRHYSGGNKECHRVQVRYF